MSRSEADVYFRTVLGEPLADESNLSSWSPPAHATGSESVSGAQGWAQRSVQSQYRLGLVNAMTEYVDHRRRARNQGITGWIPPGSGQGAQLKQQAMTQALALLQ